MTSHKIRRLEHAATITDRAFAAFVQKDIGVGTSEIQLRNALSSRLREAGADGRAFPIIVAFGKHAASPHHKPTTTKLQKQHAILIDVGATYRGFCADMTRMLFLGRPSKHFMERYRLVLRAQKAALRRARPRMTAAELDLVARSIIDNAGYLERFIHTTGHGIGRNVHEKPSISMKDKTVLKPGMTFTIEPGIYDKRWGGIRIEDTVVMEETGVRRLTKTPKNLIILHP